MKRSGLAHLSRLALLAPLLAGIGATSAYSGTPLQLEGDEATTLANALVGAGIPNSAIAPARFQANADTLGCDVSSATGGALRCHATADGKVFSLAAADAINVFQLLSRHGGTHGGEHMGRVWAHAGGIHCEHDVDVPTSDLCTLTLE